ncbi:MAG: tripartite tricarboxylate transporter substrate binding protein [Nocardioidaceae bacterium]
MTFVTETRRRTATLASCLAVLAVTACGGGGGGSGAGDDGAKAYEGETIDFVVPYEPGGGYDVYARAVGPYLAECLGATVVVKNEPGAGGLRATAETAAAKPDENRIQILNTVGVVSAQIAEAEGAHFDLNKFSWLGRLSSPPNVLVVGTDSPIESFDDIVNSSEELRFVAQGPGANDFINPNILGAAYGFPFKIITGFAGSPEARASVVAGDADAHILPVDSQLEAIEAGDVRPIVTIDKEPDPLLPDVPTVYDTPPENPDGQEVIDNLVAMSLTGRGVVAPPGLDKEKLAALRDGLACATSDEKLVADLESQKRPLAVLDGEETAELVADVLDSPESFQDLVRDSY